MPQSLTSRLRAETQEAHQRLEDGLALLEPPLSQARFTHALGRFHGFHAVWEPAIAGLDDVAPVFAGRSRLAHLRRDLAALGVDEEALARAPVCAAAAGLAADAATAFGSLYVLEGSTLGGQLIARALQGAAWLPPGGLGYFSPYGAETGAMWRTLRDRLDAVAGPDQDRVLAGAEHTFSILHDWVAAPLEPAASAEPSALAG